MPIDTLNSLTVTSLRPTGEAAPARGMNVPATRQELPQEDASASAAISQMPQMRTGKAQVEEVVSQLNDYVQIIQRDIAFSVDEDTGKTVVRVTDSESGDLIRQIPSEEVIAISQALAENLDKMEGVILREQA